MSDLYNEFPSWGETGDYPQDGFFYEGGDQVNEKHMDALWNGVQKHIDNLNTAIRDRVRDLHGNVVLDQGLVASIGGGTREVDVTASSGGAYVSGQYTGSVSAQTTSHTANSGGSTRTDVVYLGQDGNVSKSEGTASAPADTLKIAEVDVATDDSINDVRNYARDHAHVIASENQPTGAEPGDLWQDHTANREKVYQSGAWRKLLTDQDSATITAGDGLKNGGSFDLDGGSVTLDIEPADFAGDGVKDDGSDNIAVEPNDFAGSYLTDDASDNLNLNIDLVADDIVGDGLKSPGSSIDIEPADFAGNGLSDDGNDNLEITASTGTTAEEQRFIRLSQTHV
jgi:hypothetical protein